MSQYLQLLLQVNDMDEKKGITKDVHRLLCTIVMCVVLGVLCHTFSVVVVPTESMSPTIPPNSLMLVYQGHWVELERQDIISFEYPLDKETLYVKRIIGMPGEHIDIDDGKVFVDGKVLNECYLAEEWVQYNDGYSFDVPEDAYLVLGDNRNVSFDARFWREQAVDGKVCSTETEAEKFAYVRKESVRGKFLCRLCLI